MAQFATLTLRAMTCLCVLLVGERMSNLEPRPPKHDPLWATIVIAFGLIVTAAWIGLLGYGLVKLIELAI